MVRLAGAANRPARRLERACNLARAFAEAPQKFSDEELVRRSVPTWLSEFVDVTPAFARALQTPAKLWLRARRGQGSALAQRLGGARLTRSVADAVEYLGDEDLFQHPGFKNGDFEIQDISSQLVGSMADPQPGANVVGHLRGRRRQAVAHIGIDEQQRVDLGE